MINDLSPIVSTCDRCQSSQYTYIPWFSSDLPPLKNIAMVRLNYCYVCGQKLYDGMQYASKKEVQNHMYKEQRYEIL